MKQKKMKMKINCGMKLMMSQVLIMKNGKI